MASATKDRQYKGLDLVMTGCRQAAIFAGAAAASVSFWGHDKFDLWQTKAAVVLCLLVIIGIAVFHMAIGVFLMADKDEVEQIIESRRFKAAILVSSLSISGLAGGVFFALWVMLF